MPSNPIWINQIHSSICVDASRVKSIVEADAIFTSDSKTVCGILTADCLPVFVSNNEGSMVGIAHAGWRGLLSGVIENLIESFDTHGDNLIVKLGPAISMSSFEVGEEVRALFLSKDDNFARSFYCPKKKYFLDLYDAARVVLERLNISSIYGEERCTYKESNDFFSNRRDGINSGRMAHLIWMR